MPFPNFPKKYNGTPILSAGDVIAYQRKQGYMFKNVPPLDGAIICLNRGLPERLKRKFPYKKASNYIGDLYILRLSDKNIAVATNFGFGAPVVAALAEELVTLGTKRLISIGLAGALQPDLISGDLVLCQKAIRDEGTSHHYLPTEKYVNASQTLVNELGKSLEVAGRLAIKGATWSTDAPFRELREEVQQYQSEGIQTVEMESAALFAVAQVRGIQAASVFVVGDSLAGGTWRPPGDLRSLDNSFEAVYGAVIETLAGTTG
jgi:uridine phosphorylase